DHHETSDTQTHVSERRTSRAGAASARRDDSGCNRMGEDGGPAGAEARLRLHPDGMRSLAMDSTGAGEAHGAVAYSVSARTGQRPSDRDDQHAAAERVPGYA